MHLPSSYELYLLEEDKRCYKTGTKCPEWLNHEHIVYYWIFRLSRSMEWPLMSGNTVSKQMLLRVKNIPTSRMLKYRDVSPELRNALNNIATAFSKLDKQLQGPEMWRRPYLLSLKGQEVWKEAGVVVYEGRHVNAPEVGWRDQKRMQQDKES